MATFLLFLRHYPDTLKKCKTVPVPLFQTQVCIPLAMAPHSSTLAWKIPGTEEPGRLQSMGSRRVGHD